MGLSKEARDEVPETVPKSSKQTILQNLESYTAAELRRLVADLVARPKVGLYWERNAVERDRALNDAHVFTSLDKDLSFGGSPFTNLVIEGDNFDALRLLRTTHKGKIRVIFVDPPYNTGNKDFVYNDRFVNKDDRDRQSTWLDWLYRRFKLAWDLLTPDGVLLACINDENRSRLELLLEAAYPGRRVGSFVWKSRKSTNDDGDHRFSSDHEHVLVFAKEDFVFDGVLKRNEDYKFEDADKRKWASAPLNVSVKHDSKKAGNAFYPLHDPKTDIYYPCNPDSVWRYASKHRLKPGQKLKAEPMEDLIAQGLVAFPENPRIAVWKSLKELYAAVDNGNVPESQGRPLLRRGLPGLEQLVGKRVGWGRPRLKRYLDKQDNDKQPVSSWVRSQSLKEKAEDGEVVISIEAQYSDSGNKTLEAMLGEKNFNTAKPVSLVQNILRSFCREDDIVLDFFAGSGTTAHAVLALNSEDQGSRRFIMVSSTEATKQEAGKNVCRDACAARLRVAMQGHRQEDGFEENFGYLRTLRLTQGDLPFGLDREMVWHTLCLLHGGMVATMPSGNVTRVPSGSDDRVFVVFDPEDDDMDRLPELVGKGGGVIYTDRLGAVEQALAGDHGFELRSLKAAVLTASVDVADAE